LRHRLAPAMSQDYFRAWLQPRGGSFAERFSQMFQYFLAVGLFDAYPLPQRMTGVRRALKYTGELIDDGRCPLVYPEGKRTPDGTLQPFKSGIGLMATRLHVPVVPVYVSGLYEIYSIHDEWLHWGTAKVKFGPPLHLENEPDEQSATRTVEQAIHKMASRGDASI